MPGPSNMHPLCRMCYKPTEKPISLEKVGMENLQNWTMMFLGLEIDFIAGYSNYTCLSCFETFKAWADLLKKQVALVGAKHLADADPWWDKVDTTTMTETLNDCCLLDKAIKKEPVDTDSRVEKSPQVAPSAPPENPTATVKMEPIAPVDMKRCYVSINNLDSIYIEKCTLGLIDLTQDSSDDELVHATPSFPCPKCEMVAGSSSGLKIHLARVHPELKSCPYCHLTFKFKRNLVQHLQEKTCIRQKANNQAVFFCPRCPHSFEDISSLTEHIKIQHLGNFDTTHKYPCNKCNQVYLDKKQFDDHYAKTHNQFNCTTCNVVFLSKFTMMQHVAKQHPERKFEKCFEALGQSTFGCIVCPGRFTSEPDATNHFLKFHSDFKLLVRQQEVLQSPQLLAQPLQDDLDVAPVEVPKVVKKEVLVKSDEEEEEINVAVEKINEKIRKYRVLVTASKETDGKGKLKLNFTTSKLMFACVHCKYKYKSFVTLAGHIRKHHYKYLPFNCPDCKTRELNCKNIKSHYQQCEKMSEDKRKELLENFNKALVQCAVCSHQFSLNNNTYYQHFASEHPTHVSFQCPGCKKRFVTPNQLILHFGKCSKIIIKNLKENSSNNQDLNTSSTRKYVTVHSTKKPLEDSLKLNKKSLKDKVSVPKKTLRSVKKSLDDKADLVPLKKSLSPDKSSLKEKPTKSKKALTTDKKGIRDKSTRLKKSLRSTSSTQSAKIAQRKANSTKHNLRSSDPDGTKISNRKCCYQCNKSVQLLCSVHRNIKRHIMKKKAHFDKTNDSDKSQGNHSGDEVLPNKVEKPKTAKEPTSKLKETTPKGKESSSLVMEPSPKKGKVSPSRAKESTLQVKETAPNVNEPPPKVNEPSSKVKEPYTKVKEASLKVKEPSSRLKEPSSKRLKRSTETFSDVQDCENANGGQEIDKLEIKCPLCLQDLDSFSLFVNHMDLIHKISIPKQCIKCKEQLETVSDLKLHIEKCSLIELQLKLAPNLSKNTVICKLCNFQVIGDAELMKHVQSKHSYNRSHKCDVCQRNFYSKASLNLHSKIKHGAQLNAKTLQIGSTSAGKKMTPVMCGECKIEFPSDVHLLSHELMNHMTQNNACCKICNFRPFSSVDNLMDHIKLFHPEMVFQCDKCSRPYFNQIAHDWKYHKSPKECQKTLIPRGKSTLPRKTRPVGVSYKCDLCRAAFTKKKTLRSHLSTIHLKKIKAEIDPLAPTHRTAGKKVSSITWELAPIPAGGDKGVIVIQID